MHRIEVEAADNSLSYHSTKKEYYTLEQDRDIAKYLLHMPSTKRNIRFNCVYALIKLLQKSDILSKPPYNLEKCVVDFHNQEIENAIRFIVQFSKRDKYESNYDDPETLSQLGMMIFCMTKAER